MGKLSDENANRYLIPAEWVEQSIRRRGYNDKGNGRVDQMTARLPTDQWPRTLSDSKSNIILIMINKQKHIWNIGSYTRYRFTRYKRIYHTRFSIITRFPVMPRISCYKEDVPVNWGKHLQAVWLEKRSREFNYWTSQGMFYREYLIYVYVILREYNITETDFVGPGMQILRWCENVKELNDNISVFYNKIT